MGLVPEALGEAVALAPRREHQRRAPHAHRAARARARARARLRRKIARLEAGAAVAVAIGRAIAVGAHALDALRARAFAQLDTRTPRRAEQRLDDGATVVARREDAPVGLDLPPGAVEAATRCGGGCNPVLQAATLSRPANEQGCSLDRTLSSTPSASNHTAVSSGEKRLVSVPGCSKEASVIDGGQHTSTGSASGRPGRAAGLPHRLP